MPIFALFFAASAMIVTVLVLAVHSHVFGLLTLLVLMPFWLTVTINGGFLAIIVEALCGRIASYWLVLPFVWFAGYFGMVFSERQEFSRLAAEIDTHNAGQKFAFSAHNQVLVFHASTLSMAASHFAREYPLPVTYSWQDQDRRAEYRSVRILPESYCWKAGSGVSSSGIESRRPRLSRRQFRRVTGICEGVIFREEPVLPTVTILARASSRTAPPFPAQLRDIVLSDDSQGRSATLRSGRADLLTWFPLPFMLCDFTQSKPRCDPQFLRTAHTFGGTGEQRHAEFDLIARVLGLKPSYAEERAAEIAQTRLDLPHLR